MENEKILVTGASGCLGANLVLDLVNEGKNVAVFILPNTWHPYLDGLDIEVHHGDVCKKEDIQKAMKGCTHVYHVAGIVSYNLIDNQKIYNVNYLGTKKILEVAKELGVKKVVVTASTAGIGIPEDKNKPLNEDTSFDFKRYKKVMYMYSKHLCIEECKKFSKEGLTVSIVSPTTLYGQGDIFMHIGNVVKKINEGKLKFAPPGGNAIVSIDDIVEAHKLVMEKGRSGEDYIFANECITYKEMFNQIAEILGKKKIKFVIPYCALYIVKPLVAIYEKILLKFRKKSLLSPSALNFSFKFRYFDSTKARTELGWEPKCSFKRAMEKAIDFYKERNLI